jgi:hypothetical protein
MAVQALHPVFGKCHRLITEHRAMGTKQTSWLLVRKRTIPNERPPLVGELADLCSGHVICLL